MIALDASVLIAHLDPSDRHHRSATSLLLDAQPQALLVHPVTMAEVLVGGVRVGRGTEMRDDLLAVGVDVAGYDDDAPLRLAQLRVRTGLKLPDCCALDTAIEHEASLATFDKALASAATRLNVALVS